MPARRRRIGSENENPNVLNSASANWNTSSSWNNSYYDFNGQLQSDVKLSEGLVDLEEMMSSRDRTGEFSSAVETFQRKQVVSVRNPRARNIQSHSEFMGIAKVVGQNIANTYAKLEKLTLLAKDNTLFKDRTPEIDELTYIIKGDLSSLNEQIARLQDISRNSYAGKHLKSHNSNVLLALQSKLASMSTDFKQMLERRTKNIKQQEMHLDQFSRGHVANSLPPSMGGSGYQGSVLFQEDHVSINLDSENDASQRLLPYNNQQKQTQLLYQDETDTYLQSRAETMQNIESTIVELGGIFQQLAHMVKEQEEMVERIDTNISDAEMNIDAAHTQILKYFRSVSSNRWLMIKVFGILIFFFLFFIIFMT